MCLVLNFWIKTFRLHYYGFWRLQKNRHGYLSVPVFILKYCIRYSLFHHLNSL